MKPPLKVTMLVDEAWIPREDPDFSGLGGAEAERHVAAALRELGHAVRVLGAGYDVQAVVRDLEDNPPDIVFNLVEQFADNRRLDKNVAALLEMMQVPFTGTGSAGLMLCRDKALCKDLLGRHGVGVPRYVTVPPGKAPRVPKGMPFPMIVKPVYEDASDGISQASLVRGAKELAARCRHVHERWRQPAIAEEYVDGRELYVGVLGNQRLLVLPLRELRFGQAGPRIATARVKSDDDYRRRWHIHYGFAKLPKDATARIASVCKRTFRALQLQDYCRVDLRLTPAGEIFVIEANPNPQIARDDEFADSAARAGIDYNALIARILALAHRRHEG